MSRPRLTRSFAVLVAVAAAGCGAGHHDRRAKPCLAKDLRPDAGARKFGAFQPEGGAAVGGVVLTNRGRGQCVLRGRPAVELRPTYGQRPRLLGGAEPAAPPPGPTGLLGPGPAGAVGASPARP